MAFAKVETSILNHPKFLALGSGEQGLAAIGLWTLGLAYSQDQLSDGRVPRSFLLKRVRANTLSCSAERLIRVGLWHDKGDYYLIHDYSDWNPSSEQIKLQRKAARDRMQRLRSGKPGSREQDHGQEAAFARTQNVVRQQDVDVDVDVDREPPEHAEPVRANTSSQPGAPSRRYLAGYRFPDDFRGRPSRPLDPELVVLIDPERVCTDRPPFDNVHPAHVHRPACRPPRSA